MFHLTLIFYPHHTGMRSQMLYTSVSFEICQERMFVKQRRTHGWSTYLLSKEIFMLKQKSSNLYMICFNSLKKFWVIIYALCIGMRSQMLYTNAGAELGGCLGGPLPPKILPGPPSGPPKIRSLSVGLFLKVLHRPLTAPLLQNWPLQCPPKWKCLAPPLHKRVIWNLPRANVCEAVSNTWLKQLLTVEKNIYAQAKIIKSLHDRF